MHLESLKLVDTFPSKVVFDAGAGMKLVIEPHAPGVFRIRCGLAESVAADILPGNRARAHADVLLARPEAIGEAVLEPLSGSVKGWRLVQGDTALDISLNPFKLEVQRLGKKALSLCDNGIALHEALWTVGFELAREEKIFGLGETSGDLDRRRETIISDAPDHRALPLAWGPSGWGVYVNTLSRVEHDLGAESASQYLIAIEDKTLDLFLFAAEPGEILNQYTQLTGRAGQPSLWSMGVWVEQHDTHSAAQTAELIAEFRKQNIAVDGVLLLPPSAWT